jgi:hypothetical protein
MLTRPIVIVVLFATVFTSLYTVSVRRGEWGVRQESWWETPASVPVPGHTHVYAEQRMPDYPRPLRWFAPAFATVHAIDVCVRWTYWHEREFPQFDEQSTFDVVN